MLNAVVDLKIVREVSVSINGEPMSNDLRNAISMVALNVNKIMAIKLLRGYYNVSMSNAPLSLRDAKDIVEALMA